MWWELNAEDSGQGPARGSGPLQGARGPMAPQALPQPHRFWSLSLPQRFLAPGAKAPCRLVPVAGPWPRCGQPSQGGPKRPQ